MHLNHPKTIPPHHQFMEKWSSMKLVPGAIQGWGPLVYSIIVHYISSLLAALTEDHRL